MNGTLIRQQREAKGWSQDDLERESGVSQALISYLERGERSNVTIRTLRRLAAVLEVSADDLLKDPTPAAPSAA